MSSTPVLLLNRILYGGRAEYRELIRLGFNPTWLMNAEFRQAWSYICDHVLSYSDTPGPQWMREHMPHFPFLDYSNVRQESLGALVDMLRNDYLQIQNAELFERAMALNDSDPVEATQYVTARIQELTSLVTPMEFVDVIASREDIKEEYERESLPSSWGLAYPWYRLNDQTKGMHDEEFIIIFGRPKSMKTFVALHIVVHAYLQSGARVLIISREISVKQMRKRVVALLASVAYGPWRTGRLSPGEKAEVFSVLDGLVEMETDRPSYGHPGLGPAIRIASGHSKNYRGLDLVDALADSFEPDIILDDGFYLAANTVNLKGASPMDWKVMSYLSQSAKAYAGRNKLVYLITTQANRKAEQAGGMSKNVFSYADSFAQDCNVAMRAILKDDYLLITLPATREFPGDAFPIHAVPCSDFSELSRAEMRALGIDKDFIREARARDDANIDKPAGPDDDCDSYETEIPDELRASSAPAIPGIKKPKAKPKAPKKKGGKK